MGVGSLRVVGFWGFPWVGALPLGFLLGDLLASPSGAGPVVAERAEPDVRDDSLRDSGHLVCLYLTIGSSPLARC